jgi:hypothetical protein
MKPSSPRGLVTSPNTVRWSGLVFGSSRDALIGRNALNLKGVPINLFTRIKNYIVSTDRLIEVAFNEDITVQSQQFQTRSIVRLPQVVRRFSFLVAYAGRAMTAVLQDQWRY